MKKQSISSSPRQEKVTRIELNKTIFDGIKALLFVRDDARSPVEFVNEILLDYLLSLPEEVHLQVKSCFKKDPISDLQKQQPK